MIKKQFKVILERDEDGYFVASVPSLPGCYTQSKNLKDLKKRIQEAITLCLEVAKDDAQYFARVKRFAYEPEFVGLETITV